MLVSLSALGKERSARLALGDRLQPEHQLSPDRCAGDEVIGFVFPIGMREAHKSTVVVWFQFEPQPCAAPFLAG